MFRQKCYAAYYFVEYIFTAGENQLSMTELLYQRRGSPIKRVFHINTVIKSLLMLNVFLTLPIASRILRCRNMEI